jgi:diadenosine tetraphosphatase ApaH/serine/threonine PP2A family protein phosphatase
MAKVAILYDIHGNLPALDAVLEDARKQKVEGYFLGGDYALFGAWPRETVERLFSLPGASFIRGNGERWMDAPTAAPAVQVVQGAIAGCRKALGEGYIKMLAALPEQAVLEEVRYCHGSPISDIKSFAKDGPEADDKELLADAVERRVVFGHTHIQFKRTGPGGVQLVNPGSVGMPFDGDTRAAYAIANDGGAVELRRVEYDHLLAASELERRFRGRSWTQTLVERLKNARLES